MVAEKRSAEKIRSADVYVFCLLHHKDKTTVNPLNLDQWTFYVVATKELPAGNSISLKRLETLTKGIGYEDLEGEVVEKGTMTDKATFFL